MLRISGSIRKVTQVRPNRKYTLITSTERIKKSKNMTNHLESLIRHIRMERWLTVEPRNLFCRANTLKTLSSFYKCKSNMMKKNNCYIIY